MPVRCESCARPLGQVAPAPGLPHPPMLFCDQQCALNYAEQFRQAQEE